MATDEEGERIEFLSDFDALFAPRSLAIVGASRDPKKWGYWVAENMRKAGYRGRLYGVNPRVVHDDGRSDSAITMVVSLTGIREHLDCVVIAIPQPMVLATVAECAALGVRCAVLIAAGFAETGPTGRFLEAELIRVAQEGGVRLLGPNCFGVFSASDRVNFTAHPTIPHGGIALASQSGNVVFELSEKARAAKLGFSRCVGMGNQLDIGFGDMLRYFAQDSASEAIALYIEGLKPAQASSFVSGLELCKEANKPVVVIKAGSTIAGAASAATHTASLASDDRVWSAILETGGAVRVTSTEEMIDVLSVATYLPRTARRVMVLSDGGGSTVMTVDAISRSRSLRLADLSASSVAKLTPLVPPIAPRVVGCNPMTLDTPGGVETDPRVLFECARIAAEDPGVDIIAAVGLFGGLEAFQDKEVDAMDGLVLLERAGARFIIQTAFASADVESLNRLRSAGLRIHSTIERMIAAVDAWVSSDWKRTEKPKTPDDRSLPDSTQLSVREACEILDSYGIRTPKMTTIETPAALDQQLSVADFPVCLKIDDTEVVHKTDVNGVLLNLTDHEAAKAAAAELWRRFPKTSLLLMHSYPPGVEVLIGGFRDETFGPMVMVGRGGVWAEYEDDVAIQVAPVEEPAAEEMLAKLRMSKLLLGYRGQPGVDLSGLAAVITNLSRLIRDQGGIAVDLNPVIAYPDSVAVVDVRVLRKNPGVVLPMESKAPPSEHS